MGLRLRTAKPIEPPGMPPADILSSSTGWRFDTAEKPLASCEAQREHVSRLWAVSLLSAVRGGGGCFVGVTM